MTHDSISQIRELCIIFSEDGMGARYMRYTVGMADHTAHVLPTEAADSNIYDRLKLLLAELKLHYVPLPPDGPPKRRRTHRGLTVEFRWDPTGTPEAVTTVTAEGERYVIRSRQWIADLRFPAALRVQRKLQEEAERTWTAP